MVDADANHSDSMFVQVSGIVYSNIYRTDDQPECTPLTYPLEVMGIVSLTSILIDRRGNKQLVAICSANIVIYALVKLYYIWRNKKRDKEWNAMSREVR